MRKSKGRNNGDSFADLVTVITCMVNLHDPTAASHQEEVALLARSIAEAMGCDGKLVEGVFLAGQVHDLGKIVVPAEVLSSPKRLNHNERNMVMRHPQVGYEILQPVSLPNKTAVIVHQHHERLDGSGYPLGLRGDQILLESRILAVADVVQAMLSGRSYHPPFSVAEVLKELGDHRGTLYDPDVVDAYSLLATSTVSGTVTTERNS